MPSFSMLPPNTDVLPQAKDTFHFRSTLSSVQGFLCTYFSFSFSVCYMMTMQVSSGNRVYFVLSVFIIFLTVLIIAFYFFVKT